MIKKILKIVRNIIVGIFIFYFFAAWVVIPVGLSWAIQSQGTKILNHPTIVRSVQFNPFFWRLSLYGFEITDKKKDSLISFERFSVDVSFLKLLQKNYYVESVDLIGLKINGILTEEGRVNLLNLIPTNTTENPDQKQKNTPKPEGSVNQAQPLPSVFVKRVSFHNDKITFADHSVKPNFITTIDDLNIDITGISTRPNDIVSLVINAVIDGKGKVALESQIKALAQPLELDLKFDLDQYALTALSPYVGKYTGHALKSGQFDLKLIYRISDNKLRAQHKLLIQHFEFGEKVESKDALKLPFGLAIALLEDPQGRINISLPAEGDLSDPKFKYTHLIWQVVSNFFTKLVTKPFSILANIVGGGDTGTDELGFVKFTPGSNTLSDEERQKLKTLAQGLKERPKLRLVVNGSYDSEIDWRAIKLTVFTKDFDNLRKESTKQEKWVYEQLYQRRFGIKELWKLNNKFKLKDGTFDIVNMNAEIKRQLVEDASPDQIALEVLAQERAKIILDALIESGLSSQRVELGKPKETQATMGFIPLEFTLTVFEE